MAVNRLNPEGIYLALGGGAARGFAHLGVLKALQKHNIPIAGICGTSMGALVGSCYALSPDAEHVSNDFISYIRGTHFHQVRYSFMRKVEKEEGRKKKVIREKLTRGLLYGLSYTTGSVISFQDFKTEISSMVPNKTFKNTVIPLFATTVDLTEGKEVLLDRGFLRSAVMASSAIPGVFPAVQSGQSIYVDGGWMNRNPVNPLRVMGARKVIAVDVSEDPIYTEINPKRGYTVLSRANELAKERLHQVQAEGAAIYLKPPVTGLHWADFANIEKVIAIGQDYAELRMDEIKRLVEPAKPPKSAWQRLLDKIHPHEPEPLPCYTFEVRALWDVVDAKIG